MKSSKKRADEKSFAGGSARQKLKLAAIGHVNTRASQLDAEIAEALAERPKNTVTILTVTHIPRDSSAPLPEQLFVFAHRERALDALGSLTDPETDTTINIRTLEVIR